MSAVVVDTASMLIDAGSTELPDSIALGIRDATRRELAGLSPLARRAVEVASILGHTFSFDHVAAMLDVVPASLLGPLEELVLAGLIRDDGTHLAFLDDLLHQAVIATVPASARNALQRQAIDVLVSSGASPREPAMHLARAAHVGDAAAISALVTAAEALGVSDPAAAADLSRRAFDLTAIRDERRSSIAAETAILLHAAGRAEDGKALVDAVLRGRLAPEGEAEVRMSLARMTDVSPEVRVESGRAAVALSDVPDAARAEHLARLVDNLLDAGQPEFAHELLPEATTAVIASADPAGARALQLAKSRLSYVEGAFQDAVHCLDASPHARDDVADQWRAELLVVADQCDEAEEVTVEAIEAAQRNGHASLEKTWRRLQGRYLLQTGRLSDAAATLSATVKLRDAEALTTPSDAAALLALGRIAIHTGDTRSACTWASVAETALDDASLEMRRQAAWFLALHALAAGDPAGARARLATLEGDGDSFLPTLMVDITDPVVLVRIGRATGDDELARGGVAAAEHRHELNPDISSIAATAAHARGLSNGDLTALADACRLFDSGPRVLARASAHEDYGLELVRTGDRTRGIEELGHALQMASGAGAVWDAARSRSRLRELGVRRRIAQPTRPSRGWAGLTQAEIAVARLVAEGLKNREVAERLFVSAHTVSMHLRHAFTKLNINSRVELTRLVYLHEEAA